MARDSQSLIQQHVAPGRHTAAEVAAVVARARTSVLTEVPLARRPDLPVSLPGAAVARLGDDVVLGVPRAVLDDQALRKIARACPDVWFDGRWYPADAGGLHLLMATTLTVADPDGIAQDVAALLDVPADEARFDGAADRSVLRFVRLTWAQR